MDSMVAKVPSYRPLNQYKYNVSLVNEGQYTPSGNYGMENKLSLLFTWTRSDAAHDHLHCLPFTEAASILSWGVSAGPHPGPVALTTGA